ncbi:MAG: serine hydrolase domain-containing protein [Candidatus Thorarchaeota archaeon]
MKTDTIHKYIQDLTTEDKFSGVFLLAKDGAEIFKEAYGLACRKFNVPNKTDTIFNIGSLNKIITKIAILQLMEREKVSLEDTVGKFLPDFPDEIATKVTVKHLLTFTSGMGDYFNEKFTASIGNLRSLEDFVKLFIDDPLSFEPGSGNQYSNAGYVVLGRIIEVASGQNYYDYVRDNIYTPAGMKNTDHYELDYPIRNLATGYTTHGSICCEHSGELRNNYYHNGTKGSSAGGGYSTAEDLLRFHKAIINNTLLKPENTERVFKPIDSDPSRKLPAAILAGGAPGLSSFLMIYFDLGYVGIILSNRDPELVEPVFKKIHEIITSDTED